jgi:hypothetical protein
VHLFPHIDIQSLDLNSLSGSATGNGPRRQVLSEALDDCFADAATFRKLSDEGTGYYGPAIRALGPTARSRGLELAGFLTAVHLRWTGLLPLRLSPCALLATFDGDLSSIYDHGFLAQVLPDSAAKLQLWDRYAAAPFREPFHPSAEHAEMSSLVINHLHNQVRFRDDIISSRWLKISDSCLSSRVLVLKQLRP